MKPSPEYIFEAALRIMTSRLAGHVGPLDAREANLLVKDSVNAVMALAQEVTFITTPPENKG